MFSDQIGDVCTRLGERSGLGRLKARSTELRFEQHRLSTREANAIGHRALIDGYIQNTDMGIRRGEKTTGGGGDTTRS